MTTNLALIEELYRAFREKDYEAFAAICAPNVEWIQNPGFPGGGHHVGAAAIVEKVFKAFNDTWERFSYRIDRMHDAGDAVIVTGAYEGLHRKTGKTFTASAAHLYEIAEGKLVRYRQFADTKVIWDAMA